MSNLNFLYVFLKAINASSLLIDLLDKRPIGDFKVRLLMGNEYIDLKKITEGEMKNESLLKHFKITHFKNLKYYDSRREGDRYEIILQPY